MSQERFSYRSDPAVPPFDDTAALIVFDGMCVLCSSGVAWMMRHDPRGSSRFAAAQSPLPRALYRHYGLDPDAFHTFLVLADGIAHTKWAGLLAAARTLPRPWRWLGSAGKLVPTPIGDRIYDWVQRNRLQWFGSRSECMRPEASQRARFLNPVARPGSAPQV